MANAVANAVAHGGLNLPGRFQLPPADGANQAAGAAPAAGRPSVSAAAAAEPPELERNPETQPATLPPLVAASSPNPGTNQPTDPEPTQPVARPNEQALPRAS